VNGFPKTTNGHLHAHIQGRRIMNTSNYPKALLDAVTKKVAGAEEEMREVRDENKLRLQHELEQYVKTVIDDWLYCPEAFVFEGPIEECSDLLGKYVNDNGTRYRKLIIFDGPIYICDDLLDNYSTYDYPVRKQVEDNLHDITARYLSSDSEPGAYEDAIDTAWHFLHKYFRDKRDEIMSAAAFD
jgi:hypothetical protein